MDFTSLSAMIYRELWITGYAIKRTGQILQHGAFQNMIYIRLIASFSLFGISKCDFCL